MAIDNGRPIAGSAPPNWGLPEIVDIKMRYASFEPRKHKHFRSELADRSEAVEFIVRLKGPIPARALAPALFVGGVRIIESEALGKNEHRFVALSPDELKRGAAISWGWLDSRPADRQRTKFRFDLRR